MSSVKSPDILIMGAGAAGMMTAISAAMHGAKNICLINATSRLGLKILMAGGGRCNITNAQLNFKSYFGSSPNAVKKIIRQFPPEKMISFLEEEGVRCKIEEPWYKYFPVSDKAQSVLDALLGKIHSLGVDLHYPVKALDFVFEGEDWVVRCEPESYRVKQLVIASGGFSYPHTGSDGQIWPILRRHGISLEQEYAALTPLKTADPDMQKLSGISTWVTLTVKNKKDQHLYKEENSILFTHNGLSGPGILDISQWFFRRDEREENFLEISFLPNSSREIFEKDFLGQAKKHPRQITENYLATFFPRRLAQSFLARAKIEGTIHQVTKGQRKALLKEIFSFSPRITGSHGYKKAEVTGGGIPLTSIENRTMEIKKYPKLYAVGEIVDVHGIIGGYNFQWAWSSGWVCGKALAQNQKTQD